MCAMPGLAHFGGLQAGPQAGAGLVEPRAAASCIPPLAQGMVTTGTPARLKGVV